MKTFKIFSLFFLSIYITSCSNDDDSNNGTKGYFPTSIEKTDFTNPNFNRVYVLSYNAQNRLSGITATSPSNEVVIYELNYTNNLLTQILTTGQGTSNTVTHEFAYTSEGILSSYIINDDGDVNTYPITYFQGTNSYTLTDESETYTLDFDVNNNISVYSLPFGNIQVNSNFESTGVFQHSDFQPALHLFFGIFNGTDYYFFNPYEIESVVFGSDEWSVNSTRDSNNNMSVINYLQGDTNVGELRITYQQRTL